MAENIFVPHLDKLDKTLMWLAEETGYDVTTISAWGNKKNFPRVYAALDVAQALKTSVENIWGKGDGSMKPKKKQRPGKKTYKTNIFLPFLEDIDKTIGWLAEQTGYTTGVISSWGNERAEPGVYKAIDVADALGVTVYDIWGVK